VLAYLYRPTRFWHASCCAIVLLLQPMAPRLQSQERVNQNAQAVANFQKRVEAYMSLHKKLEASLPKLPKEATPEQIDRDQRALQALIAAARAEAKPGDIFTQDIQLIARSVMARLFAKADRQKMLDSINDENPGNIRLAVNGRYPDTVPLANMPAELLKALPPLPDELEYRFVGDALILLDAHAHIVVDFFQNVLPKK
jgi:hypothetical protein